VLEGVLGIWRRSTPEDQFRAHQLREGVIDMMPRHRCRRALIKLACENETPKRRSDLRHLSGGRAGDRAREKRSVQAMSGSQKAQPGPVVV